MGYLIHPLFSTHHKAYHRRRLSQAVSADYNWQKITVLKHKYFDLTWDLLVLT